MKHKYCLYGSTGIIICTLVFSLLCSCELLHQDPLTVTGHAPSAAVLPTADNIDIWISFSSSELDRTSVEEAFSLSEESAPMEGNFHWSGDRLSFVPLRSLSMGKSYTMRVSASAEDRYGNNLKGEFSFTFRVGQDTTRPTVTSIDPADGTELTDQFYPIAVTFSELVDHASFYEAFSVSPGVTGSYTWDETGGYSVCTFTPQEAWTWQTDYTVTISTDLKDPAGNSLGDTYISGFSLGTDHEPPTFSVYHDEGGVTGTTLQPNVDTAGWEASWPITILFDEAVNEPNSSKFQLTPALSFTMDWDHTNNNRVVLTPNGRFKWGTMYTLVVTKGITDLQGNTTTADTLYRFTVDGTATRPPRITKVYSQDRCDIADPNYGVPLAMWETIFEGAGACSDQDYYFDFYIEHADGVDIPETYFLENFDIDITDACVTLTPQSVEINPTSPAPIDAPAADETVVRVHCLLSIDESPPAGLVELIVKSDFKDSAGNPIAQEYDLILNKP